MKILYLTGDTTIRASAFSLFTPLYETLVKTNKVVVRQYHAMKLYGDRYKRQLMETGDCPKLRKGEKVLDPSYINDNYDLIVLENPFPYWYEDWNNIKPKRVLVLGDLHRLAPIGGKWPYFFNSFTQSIGELSAILTKYKGKFFRKHYKSLDIPVYHWPHSINPDIFHDYKLKKKYGVLSTGILNKDVYPLRNTLNGIFDGKKYYKRINRPPNRTDRYPNPWPVGKDYAKEINKAQISIACTSKFSYTLAKLFEIPACNSVLLCDYTKEMESLGFIPDVNFLEVPQNRVVEYVQDMMGSNILKEISNNGYEMVRENHTVQKRVEEFITYCKRILS